MTPYTPKKDSKQLQEYKKFVKAIAEAGSGQRRGMGFKGGTYQTGKRSKAPRNIASRKPVKRHD